MGEMWKIIVLMTSNIKRVMKNRTYEKMMRAKITVKWRIEQTTSEVKQVEYINCQTFYRL